MARLLTILLLMMAAASGLVAGFEISQIQVFSSVGDYSELSEETRWAHGFIRNALLLTRLVLFGMIALAFIVWLHRSRVNARAFGCRKFRYPRIWTIIGFFVPLINLFRPYQVVSEVWRASDSRGIETPVAWISMPVSRGVLAWWSTFLASLLLELLALGLDKHSGPAFGDMMLARGVGVLAGVTSAASAILAYLVISGIEEAQEEKWEILRRVDAEVDAADPHRIDCSLEPEPPPITARSIWRAHTADS